MLHCNRILAIRCEYQSFIPLYLIVKWDNIPLGRHVPPSTCTVGDSTPVQIQPNGTQFKTNVKPIEVYETGSIGFSSASYNPM